MIGTNQQAALTTAEPEAEEAEDDTAYVGRLVTYFEDAEEASDQARKVSEQCRDYYDSKQLTAAEKKALNDRGQPDIIINRIGPKIDYLLGYETSVRTDPRAFPRTPADEDAAEAATDALRYVEDANDLDQKFSVAWENMLIEGFGGVELVVDDQTGDIEVKEWYWDRLFYDPHSRRPDFTDARYLGGVIWMDAEEATAKWPDAKEAIELTLATESMDRTYDDKPLWKKWTSGKNRKRVRICQIYHKDETGQWTWCIFTKGGKIAGGPVNFVDNKGMSWCPLMLQSAYVDRDNNRYGLVKIMLGPQDEINKRRSKALHMLTVKQVVTEKGSVDDVEMARTELAKSDGWIEKNPGFELEVIRDDANIQGHLSLLQEAKNEIELIGPNAAMLGKQGGSSDPSGRAILANQQGGQTELSRLLDRHRALKQRVFQGVWHLIRQYWTEERWIRVTDDEKNVRFVGFNRPVTMGEELAKRATDGGMPPEEVQALVQQIQADPMKGPMLEQVVRMENVAAEMQMDITLEQVPDVANIAQEQFSGLIELAKAGVTFPPEVYIESSMLRNKSDIIEKFRSQQSDPAKDAANKGEIEKLFAEVGKIKAETLKTLVEADVASQPVNQITNPAVVEAGGAPPPQMPQQQPQGFPAQ